MPMISPTAISPHNRRGISWQAYWATRNPSALIVTGMRDTEIDFSWTDNSAGDCSFKIYKSTDGVTYAADGTTLAGDTTYTATGLTAGVLYYFYVVGVKDANESDPTNIYDTRFKITVDTTKAGSAADTFVLPTSLTGYDAYVDWGDGGAEQNITGTPGNVSHTYDANGIYQIKIRGTFLRMLFNNGGDKLKLSSIDNWGNIKWSSMDKSYNGCANMVGLYNDVANTSAVTSMWSMFEGCTVFNSAVAFDTAAVNNMTRMFYGCTAFNQSVATWNTSKVTTMSNMFFGCTDFNQSVANFDTALVEAVDVMFYGCKAFNQSVATWDTSKVINFRGIFKSATSFKQSLATFSLASATNISEMLLNIDINEAGTTTNYDATLVAWAAQDAPNSLDFHGGTSKYSAAGGGTAARASLETDDLWTITDGGQI